MTAASIRIATRQSRLALWQAEHVARQLRALHSGLRTEMVPLTTRGDTIQDRPLSGAGGKGLFTKELELAILDGRADIAVHSMKDVPAQLPDGFSLAAVLPRADPRDAFVSVRYSGFENLPRGARVGTSSLRRQAQLLARRPDLDIGSLRGNVNTRLAKLDAGNYDAIILATAGLARLGLEARITAYLAPEICLPAIGQGVIGIECRTGDAHIHERVAGLNDADTQTCIRAERALNVRLQGGCEVPVAGFAVLEGTELYLRGLVGAPDGSTLVAAQGRGPADAPEALGTEVAERLLAQGAGRILAALQGA